MESITFIELTLSEQEALQGGAEQTPTVINNITNTSQSSSSASASQSQSQSQQQQLSLIAINGPLISLFSP